MEPSWIERLIDEPMYKTIIAPQRQRGSKAHHATDSSSSGANNGTSRTKRSAARRAQEEEGERLTKKLRDKKRKKWRMQQLYGDNPLSWLDDEDEEIAPDEAQLPSRPQQLRSLRRRG